MPRIPIHVPGIVIPARNAYPIEAELDHVVEWAQMNDLKLNRAKSVEIIFEDRRRKSRSLSLILPPLSDIHRESQIKILGIVTNYLSVSEHVRNVTCKCRQSVCALKSAF